MEELVEEQEVDAVVALEVVALEEVVEVPSGAFLSFVRRQKDLLLLL